MFYYKTRILKKRFVYFFRFVYAMEFSLMSKSPKQLNPLWNIMKPFSFDIWCSVAFAMTAYVSAILFFRETRMYEIPNDNSLQAIVISNLFALVREGNRSILTSSSNHGLYAYDWQKNANVTSCRRKTPC